MFVVIVIAKLIVIGVVGPVIKCKTSDGACFRVAIFRIVILGVAAVNAVVLRSISHVYITGRKPICVAHAPRPFCSLSVILGMFTLWHSCTCLVRWHIGTPGLRRSGRSASCGGGLSGSWIVMSPPWDCVVCTCWSSTCWQPYP